MARSSVASSRGAVGLYFLLHFYNNGGWTKIGVYFITMRAKPLFRTEAPHTTQRHAKEKNSRSFHRFTSRATVIIHSVSPRVWKARACPFCQDKGVRHPLHDHPGRYPASMPRGSLKKEAGEALISGRQMPMSELDLAPELALSMRRRERGPQRQQVQAQAQSPWSRQRGPGRQRGRRPSSPTWRGEPTAPRARGPCR